MTLTHFALCRLAIQFFSKSILTFICIIIAMLSETKDTFAKCVNFPSLDLSQDEVMREVSEFYPFGDYHSQPRYKRPQTEEVHVYIVSYGSILETEYGRSIQDKIIELANIASRRTCSSLSISTVKCKTPSMSNKLSLSELLLRESTIVFVVSDDRNFISSHGGKNIGNVYGPPLIESEDLLSRVTAEVYRTMFDLNQYLVVLRSDGVPSRRYEYLKLAKIIERTFNLSQGCKWNEVGRCNVREEVWRFMYNKEIMVHDYWKDSLSVYLFHTQIDQAKR